MMAIINLNQEARRVSEGPPVQRTASRNPSLTLRATNVIAAIGCYLACSFAFIADAPAQTELTTSESPATPTTTSEPITEDDLELFELFVDTLDQVQANYVRPISRRELMDAAIEGVLGKLDDYSDYISPQEMPDFRREVEQQFGGIGIQLAVIDGIPTITTPLLSSPAFRAGIKAGDVITHVDGQRVTGFDLDGVIDLIKGELGTPVTLTLSSDAEGSRDVTLDREVVHVETVMSLRRDTDGHWNHLIDQSGKIGYIRLTAFSATTTDEVKEALEQLYDKNAAAVILDVRFNPGGLLTTSVEVADLFLAHGKIVRTAGRDGVEGEWAVASPNSEFEQVPMVVLVNRFSASGSEIVAASLQDHDRALVIGERTWGKGSVQQLIPMESGRSALKLTTASYQRPSGKNIHRFKRSTEDDEWGVRPDAGHRISLSPMEMRDVLEFQRDAFVIPNDDTVADSELPEDPQLADALEYLKEQLSD